MFDARVNSLRNLSNLYSVVVGVALTSAIYNLIDPKEEVVIPFEWETFFLFLAFIVTILPFYHGALRHLDATYIEDEGKSVQNGAVLADFIILFIEGCFFIALTVLMENSLLFIYAFIILLIIDVSWGFLAHLAFSPNVQKKAENKWAMMNLITIGLILILLARFDSFPFFDIAENVELTKICVYFFLITLLRTIVDYVWTWSFYYPESK